MSAPLASLATMQTADSLPERLRECTRRLALALMPSQEAALLEYLDLLHRWSAVYNLTAVRDPAQALTQHIADCLAVIHPLRRTVSTLPSPRLLDVGSGAGLPGLVIAIVCTDMHVTCVDSVGKKVAFVQEIASALQLPNLDAVHCRVEDLGSGSYDVVASRAYSSLAHLAKQTQTRVARNGAWMCMKGQDPEDERHELVDTVHVFHVEQISVPMLDAQRCIVWMKPVRRFEESVHTHQSQP